MSGIHFHGLREFKFPRIEKRENKNSSIYSEIERNKGMNIEILPKLKEV